MGADRKVKPAAAPAAPPDGFELDALPDGFELDPEPAPQKGLLQRAIDLYEADKGRYANATADSGSLKMLPAVMGGAPNSAGAVAHYGGKALDLGAKVFGMAKKAAPYAATLAGGGAIARWLQR